MSTKPLTDYVYDPAEMLRAPGAVLDRIRRDGDVLWSPRLRRWLVLSQAAATAVLRNPRFAVYDQFRSFDRLVATTGIDLTDLIRVCDWIPFLHDGPRHAELRRLFARLIADLRADYLTHFARVSRSLLAAMAARGGGDMAADYADRLHVGAIAALAGLAEEDRDWIVGAATTQGAFDFAASLPEVIASNHRSAALLRRLDSATDTPRSAVFMARIGRHLTDAGIGDSRDRRIDCLAALILVGRDSLAGTVSIGLAHMLDTHHGHLTPADWPGTATVADELIRLSSVVQLTSRVATERVELAGQVIAPGETMMIFLLGANQDPLAYLCPHAMNAGHGPHIAFGSSRHLCIGMPLSRAAIRIAVAHLSRLGEIGSRPGRAIGPTRIIRKYDSLPVELRPAA